MVAVQLKEKKNLELMLKNHLFYDESCQFLVNQWKKQRREEVNQHVNKNNMFLHLQNFRAIPTMHSDVLAEIAQ